MQTRFAPDRQWKQAHPVGAPMSTYGNSRAWKGRAVKISAG